MSIPAACPHCGLAYRDLRTGETFASVRRSLFVSSSDRSTWRHKRRHSVLGAWHQLKLALWREHRAECEYYRGQKA